MAVAAAGEGYLGGGGLYVYDPKADKLQIVLTGDGWEGDLHEIDGWCESCETEARTTQAEPFNGRAARELVHPLPRRTIVTESEALSRAHVDSALLAVHKINDLLGFLIRDDEVGNIRTLCECTRTLANEAADHLDRPWPKGGAS